ncbi:hypothetical protein [Glycomyces artemisiae]|uniref:Alginate lyase n=1 Tax=Glycomyces artemisiae TaxID=1076443 RepID=A0A2T0UQ12_9ACTN|nr:hypothetical protein [Glycomyces artemisiae]PRY60011.1 hypothetical protein B0I28_103485 [Glycomyces artemisiae]
MNKRRRLLVAGGALAAAGGFAAIAPFAAADTLPTDADTGAAREFGYPVYTRTEIDAWSTSSPQYGRLAGSWGGNVNRSVSFDFGAQISSTERDRLRDESAYVKVQAVLWAADGNAARRSKVVGLLDQLRAATSWQTDTAEQYRLVAGWACTNLAQAAAIVGYHDSRFEQFLTTVCYPLLDWSNGANWHGSFADSRLAIAAYTGDTALWEDATAYFNQRIAQSVYHSEYDGDTVAPLLGADGAPNIGLTRIHWRTGTLNADLTPVEPSLFPDGVNAERRRDLAHVSMGLGAFVHGARTIRAQGDELAPHAYDRLHAAYVHHAERVLTYLETGAIPDPQVTDGDGGSALKMAWFPARAFFGADTPADVLALCEHGQVTGSSPVGGNHLVAEAFADGA